MQNTELKQTWTKLARTIASRGLSLPLFNIGANIAFVALQLLSVRPCYWFYTHFVEQVLGHTLNPMAFLLMLQAEGTTMYFIWRLQDRLQRNARRPWTFDIERDTWAQRGWAYSLHWAIVGAAISTVWEFLIWITYAVEYAQDFKLWNVTSSVLTHLWMPLPLFLGLVVVVEGLLVYLVEAEQVAVVHQAETEQAVVPQIAKPEERPEAVAQSRPKRGASYEKLVCALLDARKEKMGENFYLPSVLEVMEATGIKDKRTAKRHIDLWTFRQN